MRSILLLILFTAAITAQTFDSSLVEQTQLPDSNNTSFLKNEIYSFSGEVGTYGEVYGASGIESRRPGSTARMFFRPTLSIYNTLTFNFDFLLSTEGNSARQSMNQFGVHPEWSWGRAHAGDFSLKLSDLTLDGITIRGGGIELFPWKTRFAAVGGTTTRAVEGNAVNATYRREVFGGKIGYGKDEGDFIELNFFRAKDIIGSLQVVEKPDSSFFPDTTDVIDSLYATTQNDQFVVTPQENMLLGLNTGFDLFDGLIEFSGEIDGCLYSRDTRVEGINDTSENVSGFVKSLNSIYKVRLSSSADYAAKTQMKINLKNWTLKGGFTRVGASYTSLGLASQVSDRQGFDAGLSTRQFKGLINFSGSFRKYSDNLADQKRFTTSRSTIVTNLNIRPVNEANITLVYTGNLMKNDSPGDTLKIDNTISNYMVNLSYFFMFGTVSNTANAAVMYQTSKDGNILRTNYNSNSTTFMLSISSNILPNLSISPFSSYTHTVFLGTDDKLTTIGLSTNYSALEGKLNNSLSISNSNSGRSKNFSVTLQSGYPVWLDDTLNLMVRFAGIQNTQKKFSETMASLSWAHRF